MNATTGVLIAQPYAHKRSHEEAGQQDQPFKAARYHYCSPEKQDPPNPTSSQPVIVQAAPSNKKLEDELEQLKEEVWAGNERNARMERLAQIQVYQWAMVNSSIGSFEYNDEEEDPYDMVKSEKLASEVIQAFTQDCRHWLWDDYYIGTADGRGRAAFRTALSEQIHTLTGQRPRITKLYNKNVGRHLHNMFAS